VDQAEDPCAVKHGVGMKRNIYLNIFIGQQSAKSGWQINARGRIRNEIIENERKTSG
jgi:hypothetical protein